jgi:hypothetical protein
MEVNKMAQSVNIVSYGGYIGVLANRFSENYQQGLSKQLHPLVYQGMKCLQMDLPLTQDLIYRLRVCICGSQGHTWGVETEEKVKIITETADPERIVNNFLLLNPKLALKIKSVAKKKSKSSKERRLKKMRAGIARKSGHYLEDAKAIYTKGTTYRTLARLVGCSVGYLQKHKKEIGIGG